MDSDSMETNYCRLKEMVLDEEKLVTYVSLSKELCIHTNQSKLLLKKMECEKDGNQPLSVNYIISGLTGDNKALTKVFEKSELQSQKKMFQSIFFEHIYSIIRGQSCVDNAAYMSINRFEDFPLYTGLVKSSSCSKRSSAEIGDLKSSSQPKSQVQEPKASISNKLQPQPEKKTGKEINGHSKLVAKPQETKSEPIIKSEVVSPKKVPSKSSIKNNASKTQKGIAGFFGKSNSMPAQKSTKPEEIKIKKEISTNEKEISTNKTKLKSEKMETNNTEDNKKLKKVANEVHIDKKAKKETNKLHEDKIVKKETNKNESKVKQNGSNKVLENIKKNSRVDKKRKRVLKVSDSESDEEASPFAEDPAMDIDNDSADEIPPTPTTNTVKITSAFINPKKKRKIVDKTYTDDEGYILTKKVEVYESCSDGDEVSTKENEPKNVVTKVEISPKETKVAAKPSKKKISPPQKGQATMMNFFKKK